MAGTAVFHSFLQARTPPSRILRATSSSTVIKASAVAAPPPATSIRAKVRYARPSESQLWLKVADKSSNIEVVEVSVDVDDARPLIGRVHIDREGFEIHVAPSQVPSWDDEAAVKAVYYPEALHLVKRVTGAKHVALLMDHIFRRVDASPVDGRPPAGETADKVHNDVTRGAAVQRLTQTFGESVASNCGRFAMVNVWRPVVDAVFDYPLGIADARTVDARDLIPCKALLPNGDAGEFQLCAPGGEGRQKWYYVPRQTCAEVLVFKQFDSDPSKAQGALHTGFWDPTAPAAGAFRPRESIEMRFFVFYDADEKTISTLKEGNREVGNCTPSTA